MTVPELPQLTGLDRVRHGLRTRHPELRFTDSGDRITVHPPNADGFSISIGSDGVVAFDGWHEHFDDESAALNFFAFGFYGKCRLKVEIRGKIECKWTLEVIDEGKWVEDSTTGLLILPFWRSPRIIYRQNSALQPM
jgi:hypothetical protein